MLTLDERLSAVVKELELGDKVADIGCDHGKIANSAVQISARLCVFCRKHTAYKGAYCVYNPHCGF